MTTSSVPPDHFADRPIVVVDVGARWGVGASWAGLAPHVRVFGFDPDPEECARLNAASLEEGDTTTTYVAAALGAGETSANLFVARQPACSSTYRPKTELIASIPVLADITPVEEVEIPMTTLDAWCRENDVTYVDALKIDTQGSELGVLRGAEDILPTVQWIEVEVEFNPIYEGQPLFGEVDAFLRERGFMLWRLADLMHYTDGERMLELDTRIEISFDTEKVHPAVRGGQLYWAQAFYARAELCRPDGAVPDREQALRGAAVAEAAGFPDLAMRALPELSGALVAAAEAVRRAAAEEERQVAAAQRRAARRVARATSATSAESAASAPTPVPAAGTARKVRSFVARGLGSLQRRVAP